MLFSDDYIWLPNNVIEYRKIIYFISEWQSICHKTTEHMSYSLSTHLSRNLCAFYSWWLGQINEKLICCLVQKNYMPMLVFSKNRHTHISSKTTYVFKTRDWYTHVGYLQKHTHSPTQTGFRTYTTWKTFKLNISSGLTRSESIWKRIIQFRTYTTWKILKHK